MTVWWARVACLGWACLAGLWIGMGGLWLLAAAAGLLGAWWWSRVVVELVRREEEDVRVLRFLRDRPRGRRDPWIDMDQP